MTATDTHMPEPLSDPQVRDAIRRLLNAISDTCARLDLEFHSAAIVLSTVTNEEEDLLWAAVAGCDCAHGVAEMADHLARYGEDDDETDPTQVLQ